MKSTRDRAADDGVNCSESDDFQDVKIFVCNVTDSKGRVLYNKPNSKLKRETVNNEITRLTSEIHDHNTSSTAIYGGSDGGRRWRRIVAGDFARNQLILQHQFNAPCHLDPTTSIGSLVPHHIMMLVQVRTIIKFENGETNLARYKSHYGSFENSYIPENPRTPKPLTFSKNRLREAKNRSNTSPVAKNKFRKNDFFFKNFAYMQKKKKIAYVHVFLFCFKNVQIPEMSLYNTYLKGFVKKNLKKNAKKKLHINKNKKKLFFRKFFFAIGLVFERFLAPRSRFLEKVNGLGVLGLILVIQGPLCQLWKVKLNGLETWRGLSAI
ncbi:hypothetical protein LXL04_009267 [Taraxacum kok-saghyz]